MKPRFTIIMSVSVCGKTTVGKALADKLGWDFYDADDYHPPSNITIMAGGIPLQMKTASLGWTRFTIRYHCV